MHAAWVSTTMHGWVDKWIHECVNGKVDDDVCTNMSVSLLVYDLRESEPTVLWGIDEEGIAPVQKCLGR